MSDVLADARRYLSPIAPSFWRWDDNASVVVWRDGSTLAFRQEILQALERFAPNGLPPFGAVLLLLAAGKSNWNEGESASRNLNEEVFQLPKAPFKEYPLSEWVKRTVSGLQSIHESARDCLDEPDLLAELPSLILGESKISTSAKKAASVLSILTVGPEAELLEPRVGMANAFAAFTHDLVCLRESLEQIDPDALRTRYRTGLDDVVEPVEIELPEEAELPASRRARQLIDELRRDEKMSGLGKLARDLMAAVHVPRSVGAREDMPLGGVSDIANRGSLDRLLVTELAQDDLTLAVRVAMNEALYLRREEPPTHPPHKRYVLLDTTLRMWGVPRAFGAAVGLAMCATADTNMDVVAYSPVGDCVEASDITRCEGLMDQLGRIEPDRHPGACFDALLGEIDVLPGAADVIVVTHRDSMKDDGFRAMLNAMQRELPAVYAITLDRAGELEMLAPSPMGARLLSKAKLEVQQLSPPTDKPHRELIDPDVDPSLPAIVRTVRFPLRLSHHMNPRTSWYVEDRGTLSITKDARLMYWDQKGKGALMLSQSVNCRNIWWCSTRAGDGIVRAIVGMQPLYLLTVDLNEHKVEMVEIEESDLQRPKAALMNGGAVLLVCKKMRVAVIDAETGRHLRWEVIPDYYRHREGRFFDRHGKGWFAMSFDGTHVRFDEVRLWKNSIHITSMFDCVESDGPIAVTGKGRVLLTEDGVLKPASKGLGGGESKQIQHSRDGARILVSSGRAKPHVVVIRDHKIEIDDDSVYGQHDWFLEKKMYELVEDRALRHRFVSVALDSAGHLAFITRKDRMVSVKLADYMHGLTLVDGDREPYGPVHSLKPINAPEGARYTLRAAQMEGGRVIVDSRGLVHLQVDDVSLPEVTLVMHDKWVSGWVSDGRVWGDEYFVGDQSRSNYEGIWNDVIKPVVKKLAGSQMPLTLFPMS